MLHKKDRGRPTEASVALEPLKYGEVAAKDFVPGADVLLQPKDDTLEIDSENSDVSERVNILIRYLFRQLMNYPFFFRMMMNGLM